MSPRAELSYQEEHKKSIIYKEKYYSNLDVYVFEQLMMNRLLQLSHKLLRVIIILN